MSTGQGDLDPRNEGLCSMAVGELARIDADRKVLRLIEAGLGDEEIMAQAGVEHRNVVSIREDLERGEPIWPVTPFELGLRRFVGEISTEEMMERLRSWPYTFGVVDYDFYEGRSWDDVVRLVMLHLLSEEEYDELQVIAQQLPDYPHA